MRDLSKASAILKIAANLITTFPYLLLRYSLHSGSEYFKGLGLLLWKKDIQAIASRTEEPKRSLSSLDESMRFLDYCAVTIEGIPVYKLTLRLKSGWNLVGSMCGIARVYHVYAYTKYWTWNLLKKKIYTC